MSRRLVAALILPALILLGGVFVVPLGWFLIGSFRELGDDLWPQTLAILTSRAIRTSVVLTNWIALTTTVAALGLGYPIAYALTRLKGLAFSCLIACVVLPYFTSIIVRTYAWMVLLGRTGVINQILLDVGLISQPLALIYNRTGVIIGMTYVLLPYMVLTLYSAMKSVDKRVLQAASGMGAGRVTVFLRVFLPQTLHGIAAGALLVFILSIGFFITPALMGGQTDLMAGMLVEREVEISNNFPVAGIMSVLLLAVTLVLYAVYLRVADMRRLLTA
jgi:putative spermidine/putrescine transport system permease protein